MAEIEMRPNVVPSFLVFVVFAIFGAIYFSFFSSLNFSSFNQYIWILIASPLIMVINKIFTTYNISSSDEISLNYNFLNTANIIYRKDQITSLSLTRNIFEKILGLGTIRFGIMGSPLADKNDGSSNQIRRQKALISIKDYDLVFNRLSKMIGVDLNEKIYEKKPLTSPKLLSVLFLVILLGTWLILNFIKVISLPLLAYNVIIFILSFILLFQIINYFILKNTTYYITKDFLGTSYDFLFGSGLTKVPLKKITNSKIGRNIFNYYLFKVGKVKVYTGGSNDPVLINLKDYEEFSENISSKYPQLTKNNLNQKSNIKTSKLFENIYPQSAFLFSRITILVLIFILLLTLMFFINHSILNLFSLLLGFILIISIIMIFMLKKNTKYELFEDKILVKTGLLNITSKEIYYHNIKQLVVSRNVFFDRILGQGTIYVFTAGTGDSDIVISNIKEYEKLYDYLLKLF